ncbi:MAG TPA: HAMP domain-containing sensor histidine kinase [Macromonas sp.]|nr:HAMP domain-containing sensor histidine kinase [Macromonas sp.]
MTADTPIDLDLLDLDVRQASALNRRAAWWLAALLLLVAVATVWLAVYLSQVEQQEAERQRNADAEWLDQTLRFHFRRLEQDLAARAQQGLQQDQGAASLVRAGQLWRGDGVVVRQGWIAARALPFAERWPAAVQTESHGPEAALQTGALAAMLDTGRGLQRAAYAGPWPEGKAGARRLWLAVPLFEQGRYQGSYVAVVDVERALEQAVPGWFLQDHALHVRHDNEAEPPELSASRYLVPVNLPGAQWTLDVRVLAAQPALAPRAFFAVALLFLAGMVVALFLLIRDVIERKRIEQLARLQQKKLEASARLVAVGEVASTLAHELNQPLGALSSFATGLLNRLRSGSLSLDEVTPVVERIGRLADKAGRVIQRVNAFARRQEMSRQPLVLNGFVRRVVGQVTLPAGLQLDIALPPRPVKVDADALLLEHALHNLVINATEWAPAGDARPARVLVSLVCESEQAGLRVEDSGPGVPEDEHARLFEAFHSQKPGGMGMGLSICRSIVEAHHGRIEVGRSAALGGAQFTVWLPLNP